MKKICLFLVLSFLCQYPLSALGEEERQSLRVAAISARALGMGGANIAISDRAEAGFWNPSGLGQVKAPQFAVLLFKEKTGPNEIAKYQFLNYAAPIGVVGTFGVSMTHVGLWEMTSDEDYKAESWLTRRFFGTQMNINQALTLSYGREILADKLFYGISLKTIQVKRKASPREWGGGVDLGLLYYPTKKLRLGICERFPIVKTGSLKKSIPETVTRIGIAYYPKEDGNFIVAGDLDREKGRSLFINLGLEYEIKIKKLIGLPSCFGMLRFGGRSNRFEKLAFRAGINRLYLERRSGDKWYDSHLNPTVGLSSFLKFGNVTLALDFASAFYKGYSEHRLMLTVFL